LNRWEPENPLHALNREWLGRLTGSVIVTSVDELADHLRRDVLPTFCTGCGRPSTECDGACAGPLEAPHHCPICARKLVVTIVPTGVTARCKVHGPLDLR
jgi:hypothetical protein